MRISQLHIKNYRSLKNITFSLQELTVFIGENDAGKSSVLDVLDLALSGGNPDELDFHQTSSQDDEKAMTADEIIIRVDFILDKWDKAFAQQYTIDGASLSLRRKFSLDGSSKTEYRGMKYEDERLNQDHSKLSAGDFDQLLDDLTIKPTERLNKDKRLEIITSYMDTAPQEEDWMEVSFRTIKQVLPTFQRYRAMDYTSPESYLTKTLQAVYESVIYEIDDEERRPIESLRELQTTVGERVNQKVTELIEYIRRYKPTVKDIQIETDVDFGRGFRTGEFRVDTGRGAHPLSKVGDGTKRRILMGTVDWDQATVEATAVNQTIIRAYDEPDTNLHYEAQRKMFDSIIELTEFDQDQAYRVQSLVCTHSLLMVNRANATSINLLALQDDGQTSTETILTDDDDEIETFLHTIARELGITNTTLFYERCYIIVEGDTEENALPFLYRRIYGSSMIDDGIRIINLEGHGAWLSLLKLLSKNRQHCTLTMLDSDVKEEYIAKFEEAAFDKGVMEDNSHWVGEQVFEDMFTDSTICSCLSQRYPTTNDGLGWIEIDIAELKTSASKRNRAKDKFSAKLESFVNESTPGGTRFSKAEFGYTLGQHCAVDAIPTQIIELFTKARKISSVE